MITAPGDADLVALGASLLEHDYWRRSTWPLGGRRGHREWLHFCVHGPGVQVIVNLSATDDLRPAAARGRERFRFALLARVDGSWSGGLEEVDAGEVLIRGGDVSARLGDLRLDLVGGGMRLTCAPCAGPRALDLTLVPSTFPSLASNVRVGEGAPINWCVVPALHATGTATIGGRSFTFGEAPAYHDHNWGYFEQSDFGWQWGHAHGAGGLTVVIASVLDARRTTAFVQSLMLWRGARVARIFRDDDVTLAPAGFLPRRRWFTVPAAAGLLVDGDATEVPASLRVEVRRGDDVVEGEFIADDLARIVVPDDGRLDAVVIHEVVGRLWLTGSVGGARLELDAPAMFEFLRRAP